MKRNLLLSAIVLIASSLFAADSSPKDDVTAAAKKLAEKANYSWKTTVVVPEGSRFRPGPTEGKTEKGGFTDVKSTFGDNTSESVYKGDKAVASNPDGGWQTADDLEKSEGPGRFFAGMLRNFKAPAGQATDLANGSKELKKDGDAITGDLTEDAAKPLLSFRRTADGVSNAKGSVKFWTKDGVLSKFEFKVSGKVSFNGNDRDVERTTTTEIKDVGTTKVEVPDDAKKKLEPEAKTPKKESA